MDEHWVRNQVPSLQQQTQGKYNGRPGSCVGADARLCSCPDGLLTLLQMYYEDDYYEGRHYEEFAGTYAQDVAGFSDEEINDIFEGDPDAYWNID